MGGLGGSYVLLIIALLAADLAFTSPKHFAAALAKPEIQYAIRLTLITCTISALLSIWVATPLGYLLSRFTFRGRWLIDTIIDIPVVLPPLVIGLSLLILFHLPIGGTNLEEQLQQRLGLRVTYAAAGGRARPVRRGLRVRRADDAGDVRPDRHPGRAGRAHARLPPQPGVLRRSRCRRPGGASSRR